MSQRDRRAVRLRYATFAERGRGEANRMAAVRVGFIDASEHARRSGRCCSWLRVAVVQIIDVAFVFDGSVAAVAL